jgi:poly(3-hydroxyoctanoate) depolymerase
LAKVQATKEWAMGVPGAQSITVGDIDIRTSIKGKGTPLLMMNGLGGSLGVLAPLQDALPDFRTIVFDPPGVGRSTPLKFPMRLPAHADYVAKFLDALGFDQVDLFGVSWGGALAQEFTHRHGDRVRRLVLTSTTPGPGLIASPDVYWAFFDVSPRDAKAYKEKVAPTLFGGKARHDAEALFETGVFGHLTKKTTSAYYFQMAAATGWTSLPYLWTLKHQTLILTGDDDPLVRPYNSRLIRLLKPNSELKILAGEGHFMIVSSAIELADHIREFLNRGPEKQRIAA